MKYFIIMIFLSTFITDVIMKFIHPGSYSLLMDFIIYVVVFSILSGILTAINPTVRRYFFHK
jgi:hypothetical protein